MQNSVRSPLILLCAFVGTFSALLLAGCSTPAADESSTEKASSAALTGSVTIDGSTTVYPIMERVVEEFGRANTGVKLTANRAGTGSGFQKFLRNEIDIVTASRPIDPKESDEAKKAGIEFIEVPIAFDGLSIIVNKDNTFVDKLTVEELKKAWGPDSTVKTWADIRAGWPAEAITFFGPTSNHGTFEYFTEAIVGEKNKQRANYQPNQEYNALVQGVANDKNSLGYIGVAYYEQNKERLRVIPVDNGTGPVEPTPENIETGTYAPLSRPLFIYVNRKAMDRPEVAAFVNFLLKEGRPFISEVGYVALPDEAYATIQTLVDAKTTGSKFQGVEPGIKLSEVLAREMATP
jgi:phosphate transport system substrate-binding protein